MLSLRNVISMSCIGVVSRTTCKTVNYCTSAFQPKQKRKPLKILINTMRPQVFLTRSDFPTTGSDLLRNECDIEEWHQAAVIPREELLKGIAGKDALFCTLTDRIDAEVIERAGPNLKVIATMSVGYEHIDLVACKKRGIRVGYTPDVLTDAVADLTIGLLLATSRRMIEGAREAQNGHWKSWAPLYMCGPAIKNSTVGIVGFGRIGQEVARRLIPFKPKKLLYSNRSDSREQAAKEIGVERCTFDQLLATSDFVILLCTLTPETTHLINAKTLSQMKRTAILINCARGQCIEQNDLYEALRTNVIKAAGIDVTTPEPLPVDNPLFSLKNCVILPHIGSAENETRTEMSRITALNIIGALKNTEMVYEL